MAAVRDIITHVEVQVAAGSRICHRNRRDHQISKGDKCLAIHDADGGRKNYCGVCATEILARAKTKVLALEQAIRN
jgi:hypothetical protein